MPAIPPAKQQKHIALLPTGVNLSDPLVSHAFLRLPHPRTKLPALYLPCAGTSDGDALLEVQRIAPKEAERSWFVGDEVVFDGTLTILTPFDPLFLLLGLLNDLSGQVFWAYDDLWDRIAEGHAEKGMENNLLRFAKLSCVRRRMGEVCETKEHDGALLYRFSTPLALEILRRKIESLANEETGILGALESTELGSKSRLLREGEVPNGVKFPTVDRGLKRDVVGDGRGLSVELQNGSFLPRILRWRMFYFLIPFSPSKEARTKFLIQTLSQYLNPSFTASLLATYSFTPPTSTSSSSSLASTVLDTTYLPGRSSSSSSLGDGTPTSNGFGAAAAAAKKRKLEENKKGSQGVERLKKVSTRGMSKLETFFGRKKVEQKEEGDGEKEG